MWRKRNESHPLHRMSVLPLSLICGWWWPGYCHPPLFSHMKGLLWSLLLLMLHRLCPFYFFMAEIVSRFPCHLEEDFRNKVKKKASDSWKPSKPPERDLSVGVTAGGQAGSQERQRKKEGHKTPFLYVPGCGVLALLQKKWRQTTSNRAQRGRRDRWAGLQWELQGKQIWGMAL